MNLWKQISILIILFVIGCLVVTPILAEEEPPADNTVILDYGEEPPFTIEDMTWLDWVNLIGILVTSIAVLFIAYQSYAKGGDPALAELVSGVQDNRPVVERGEQWYSSQPEQFQMTFKNIGELLLFIGSTTTLKTPEALGELMRDIQVPGAPAEFGAQAVPAGAGKETIPFGERDEVN